MKRILLLAILTLIGSMIIWSQVPQAMTYKAIAKDDWGVALPNKAITLRFTILQGSETGAAVYQETHTTVTNKFGLMDVEIGKGIPVIGSFSMIAWGTGVYFIKIEMDPNGGTNFRLEDPANQLLSVPYALYAESAGNSSGVNYSDLIGAPILSAVALSGNYFDLINRPLLFSGNYNDLLNKPILFSGYYEDLLNKPVLFDGTWASLEGKPILAPVALSGNYLDLTNKPIGSGIGDMQYWSGIEWVNLQAGTEGQILTMINGIPKWGSGSKVDPNILIGSPSPSNGAAVLTMSTVLSWICVDGDQDHRPLFYDVFLAGPSGTEQVGSNLITPQIMVTVHEPGSYYWRVCVKDDLGHITWGELWGFVVGYDPLDHDSDWYTSDQGDCDDLNSAIHPGATDICGDGIDQDCNGSDQTCPDDPDDDVGNVTDWDGNVYQTVKIGTQTWFKENLRAVHYNDGTAISLITDNFEWSQTHSPGYCWYNNDETNYKPIYGALYNWYAVSYNDNGGKNICPVGWHVPSDNAWINLENYLIVNGFNYDRTTTGNKIAKSIADNTYWQSSTVIGAIGNSDYPEMINASGFSADPAGIRNMGGDCFAVGFLAGFWTSSAGTENPAGAVFMKQLMWEKSSIDRLENGKNYGFSVRCIKD